MEVGAGTDMLEEEELYRGAEMKVEREGGRRRGQTRPWLLDFL